MGFHSRSSLARGLIFVSLGTIDMSYDVEVGGSAAKIEERQGSHCDFTIREEGGKNGSGKRKKGCGITCFEGVG